MQSQVFLKDFQDLEIGRSNHWYVSGTKTFLDTWLKSQVEAKNLAWGLDDILCLNLSFPYQQGLQGGRSTTLTKRPWVIVGPIALSYGLDCPGKR